MEMPKVMVLTVILLMLVLVLKFTARAESVEYRQEGEGSYYSDTLHGNKTASGAPYDRNALTAAHRSLPFGTRVKVTYLRTGKTVQVVINDRGPHVEGRIIDLSAAAAMALGMIEDGHGPVSLQVIEP